MKKLLVIICLILMLWCAMPKQENLSDNAGDINSLVTSLMTEAAIPGLAVAAVVDGKLEYVETFGYANIEQNKSVTKQTLFNIASISKPIMGIVLLQLVEQGKIDLNEDINTYLSFSVDNPKVNGDKITIRHLASHSSGINDYYDITSYSVNEDASISLKHHLMSLLTKDGSLYNNGEYYLDSMPGEKRKYSNLGAALAGHIVEEVTGLTLAQYSKKHLFPRLAMEETSWLLNDLDKTGIATPYEVEQCIPYFFICTDTESPTINHVIGEYFNPSFKFKSYSEYPHFGNPQYPDGGIRSSILEMGNLLVSILTNTDYIGEPLLSDAMFGEMFKLQLTNDVSSTQRFFWRDRRGFIGHMGSDLGVFTSMYFDPKSRTGVVILMNRGADAKASRAMQKIALAVLNG